MAIQLSPKVGSVLLCDYSKGGFQPPEMVKRRPAIVLSPRLRHRDGLCTVIPLSTTVPLHQTSYTIKLTIPGVPAPFDSVDYWAKCDMIACVAFDRLDLFRGPRLASGKREYLKIVISSAQLEAVRRATLAGLGIKP